MTLLRSSLGNTCLKQVAQYPSYAVEPHRESGQVMQFGHRLPPPCSMHLSVWLWADLLHPGSTHRLPPPCAAHLSVGLLADLLHPGSVHRLCFRVIHVLHYSMNFNSILTINSTNSTNVMVHVCLFLSSVLKPFDKCIIRMQVNEAIFHTFERSWCQPRFCFI